MKVKIVARMAWPSFRNTAIAIYNAVKTHHTCTIHDWKKVEPGGNILFIDTVHTPALKFLDKLLPESNVVFYGTTEGHSRLDEEAFAISKRVRIVAVSNFVKQMLEDIRVPVAGVLHHAINMSDKKVDIEFYRKWKTKMRRRKVILTVSSNDPRKGLDKLLKAYKAVEERNEDSFLIVHSEPKKYCDLEGKVRSRYYDLEEEARNLKIKRLWLTNLFGRMSPPKLNALYKLCTAYVQPSLSEGFGLPILEAYRFDKPIIAVDAPPFNEVVSQTETGILVPSNGAYWFNYKDRIDFKMHTYATEDLAQAILRCISDQRLLEKMQLKISQEKWGWDSRKRYPELINYFT